MTTKRTFMEKKIVYGLTLEKIFLTFLSCIKSQKLSRKTLQLILVTLFFAICFFLFLHQVFDVKNVTRIRDEMVVLKNHRRTAMLKTLLHCKDKHLEMERLQYGNYWLVRNFISGSVSRNIDCAATITYTTHGDYTFLQNLPIVVTRWLAPISISLFAPGFDINSTIKCIQYLRECLPESLLIRKFVSFHLYFPLNHMPPVLPLMSNDEQTQFWFQNCSVPPPYADVRRDHMYKTLHNLTYPINVGRNIARNSVNTHFVFACDIELYPSPGFVQKFLEMVVRNYSVIMTNGSSPRVFPIPVFELQKGVKLPKDKHELHQLFITKMAIPFHSKICKNCHVIPNQTVWLNTTAINELSVFAVIKRELKFKYWEPFYVSENREPIFDERVTWEGQKNKRIQGFAMCLMGYEYHVLNDGFLVHSPGIKVFDKKSPRLKYVPAMNKLITDTIVSEYNILFGKNKRCSV